MKRKIAVLVLTVLMALGLCGCISIPEDASVRSGTEQMISAIASGDEDAGYALISETCTKTEFSTFFRQVASELENLGEYTLTPIGIDQNSTNGIIQTMMTYRLESEKGVFLIQAMEQSNIAGLAGFHVTRDMPVITTGTMTAMNGADWIQWLVLIVGMAGWGFVIWMVVDCTRKPIPKKWLWLLLILLIQFVLTFSFSQGRMGVNFNFGIYFMSTALIRSSTGESMLRMVIPLGAMIYLSQRNKLLTPKKTPAPIPEQLPEEVQE